MKLYDQLDDLQDLKEDFSLLPTIVADIEAVGDSIDNQIVAIEDSYTHQKHLEYVDLLKHPVSPPPATNVITVSSMIAFDAAVLATYFFQRTYNRLKHKLNTLPKKYVKQYKLKA